MSGRAWASACTVIASRDGRSSGRMSLRTVATAPASTTGSRLTFRVYISLAARSTVSSGATVTAGLVIGAVGVRATGRRLGLSRQGRVFAMEFWEFLAFIANSAVFLLIGASASRVHFNALGYTSLIVTIVLVLVGRAASVYPLSFVFRSSRWRIAIAEQHVLFWAGLRGALALALALSLPDGLPMRGAVIIATFGVVTFSVIVQGLTMPALLRRVA